MDGCHVGSVLFVSASTNREEMVDGITATVTAEDTDV